MVTSSKRKSEHRKNLIGESNKQSYSYCDYTKILSKEQMVDKGQTRLKQL